MRVTSSMYYENLYGSNNSKLNEKLFDVNKQIASGLKIQYASDDVVELAIDLVHSLFLEDVDELSEIFLIFGAVLHFDVGHHVSPVMALVDEGKRI